MDLINSEMDKKTNYLREIILVHMFVNMKITESKKILLKMVSEYLTRNLKTTISSHNKRIL